MKQLWIEYDDKEGNPSIAIDSDDPTLDNETFIRIRSAEDNHLGYICNECITKIIKGWYGFDTNIAFCDQHIQLMNL
jgi:hypothetical protein